MSEKSLPGPSGPGDPKSRERVQGAFECCKASELQTHPNLHSPSWVGRNLGVARGLLQEKPCNFNTEMFVSKVGQPCPTFGQLLASRILYALLVGKKQHDRQGKILYTELLKSWSNSWSNPCQPPHPMGSCRGLPCSSPLATPEK